MVAGSGVPGAVSVISGRASKTPAPSPGRRTCSSASEGRRSFRRGRRTPGFSGPGLALLAPSAERDVMPNRGTITIDLWDPVEETSHGDFEVEPLGGNLYRVADIPDMTFGPHDFEYGDIVELEPAGGNTYELRGVRQPSGWRRFNFLISPAWVASDAFRSVLSRVEPDGVLGVGGFGSCVR